MTDRLIQFNLPDRFLKMTPPIGCLSEGTVAAVNQSISVIKVLSVKKVIVFQEKSTSNPTSIFTLLFQVLDFIKYTFQKAIGNNFSYLKIS